MSSNPRNQITIQDGRVIVKQIQGRQTQSFAGTGNKGIATTSRGNYAASQPRVVKCCNCQREWHMARQCTRPKRPRNYAWFKEKLMLVEEQEAGQILDEEQLAFLANPRIIEVPVAQQTDVQEMTYSEQAHIVDFLDNEINKLDAEQAFWLKHSNHTFDTSFKSHTPVRIEDPSELPKVSLVNESLKKLKYHLASFDKVVKNRITYDAITAGKESVEKVKKDIDEIKIINIELEHILKNELRKLKGKNVVDYVVSKPIATIALGTIGMPMSEKLVAATPMNKDKRVRFAKHVTSSSNIPKQTDPLKTKDFNKPLLPSIGVNTTTSAS
ncbi:hypothetical protein Tco_1384910 [Tanacetum coccineum]